MFDPSPLEEAIYNTVEKFVHAQPKLAFRAGEIFAQVPADWRIKVGTVTDFCKFLLARLDYYEIESRKIAMVRRGNQPYGGLYDIFMSDREVSEIA